VCVQRSCRRRKRSAKWSTTSWMPRSPNSPASRRRHHVVGRSEEADCALGPASSPLRCLLSLRYSAASAVTGECRRRPISLSFSHFFSDTLRPSTPPAASRLRLYFSEKNFYVLFLIITIYFVDTGEKCHPSSCVEVALNCSRTFVRVTASTVFAPQCCTVD